MYPFIPWGAATGPGSRFVIYDCEANMGDLHAQAKEFMHESGHNILGLRVDTTRCAGVPMPGAGDPVNNHNNPNAGHFAQPWADCDGDTNPDVWDHPVDRNDVMNSGGPLGKDVWTYSGQTWGAVKLDFGINGSVIGDAGCGNPTAGQVFAGRSPVPLPPQAVEVLNRVPIPDTAAQPLGLTGCHWDLPLA